jgi:hypothetical protein
MDVKENAVLLNSKLSIIGSLLFGLATLNGLAAVGAPSAHSALSAGVPAQIQFDGCTGVAATPAYPSSLSSDAPTSAWSAIVHREVDALGSAMCVRVLRIASLELTGVLSEDSLSQPDVQLVLTAALHVNPDDECYARAHLVASRLGALAVPHAKLFVVGDVYNPHTKKTWAYHVAVLVPVKDPGDKVVLRIVDPALSAGVPLSLGDWLKAVSASRPVGASGARPPLMAIEVANRGQLYPSISRAGSQTASPPIVSFDRNCREARTSKEFSLFGSGQTTWRLTKFKLDCTTETKGYCIVELPKRRLTKLGRFEHFAVSTKVWKPVDLARWQKNRGAKVRMSVTRSQWLPADGARTLDGLVTSIMPDGSAEACQDF